MIDTGNSQEEQSEYRRLQEEEPWLPAIGSRTETVVLEMMEQTNSVKLEATSDI